MYNAGVVKKLSVITILFLFVWWQKGYSQDLTDLHWYFGNSTSNLQFDKNRTQAYLEDNQGVPFGIGGSVVIADQFTGDLLFYSDGLRVYDRTHTLVPNGANISGATGDLNQSAVACPIPGQSDQFYIFSNTGSEIVYAIVDKTVAGNAVGTEPPLGDVISTGTATGITNPAEGMIIVSSPDNAIFWLIAQDRTTFEFQVLRITSAAITGPLTYDLTNATNPGSEAVQFAYNLDSAMIAVAPRESNRNVQILDFNSNTGILSFNRLVLNTGLSDDAGESYFDVAWSGNGSKLYMSRYGTNAGLNGNVFQFDLGDSLENINNVLQNNVFRSLGIKRGPDDLIYHLYQGNNGDPFTIGSIIQADSIIDSVQYDPDVFPGENFNATQYPKHAPSSLIVYDTLNFTYLDSCFNHFTKFFPVVDPQPATYSWDFGDGNFSDGHSPVNQYGAEGFYNVTLTVELNGITQSISQLVEIAPNQLQINLGNDTTICPGETLTLDAGQDAISYLWSTGEITQTIVVDSAGTYWVEGTAANGCTSFDEIEITVYGNQEQVSNQWYFGEMAGIDFTDGATPITDANLMESPEGCASISDINGELLFYTNGRTVWNKDHEVMVNGLNIGGDSTATQSALILPSPNETTIYYIFTTDQVNGDMTFDMRYSVVDLKHDLARGAVVLKNVSLFTNSTERLTASAFTGNIALLGKEFGNNTFRMYPFTIAGIEAPLFFPVGEVHAFSSEEFAQGYMKFSPALDLVAVAIPGTPNYIEIFDFDFQANEMSNPRLIDIQEADPRRIYGVEFSSDNSRLYVTTNGGGTSNLIQYNMDSINAPTAVTDIQNTKMEVSAGTGYGALQLGPDGQMYMAVDGNTQIGRVDGQNTDNPSLGVFDLAGRTSRLGLPNFVQNITPPTQSPGMTITAGCTGQPTTFSAVGRDNSIEMYSWDIGIPGLAPIDSQSFEYTYDSAGTYNIELTLSNRCDVDTILTQTITIFAAPETPTNPTDTAFCGDPIVLEAWPVDDPTLTYTWSTGETTRQITVTQPAAVNVFITNSDGCTSEVRTTLVLDGRPAVNLGADLTFCQDEVAPDLDAGNPGATFAWQIDGTPADTTRFQSIDTSVPGVFTYTVGVVDPISFCTGRDTIVVSIQEAPDVTVNFVNPDTCGTDGTLDVIINSTGNFNYSITGPNGILPTAVDGPTTINHTGPAGNYTVAVTNNVTGCSIVEIIQITDAAGWELVANGLPACGSDGDIELIINQQDSLLNFPPGRVLITIQNDQGQFVSDGAFTYNGVDTFNVSPLFTATNPFPINDLDTGTYFISVQDVGGGGGCTLSDTVVLSEPFPQPTITFDPVQSVCSTGDAVTVTNSSGATLTHAWSVISGVGTIVADNGNSVQVDGDAFLQVITSGANFCPRTDTIEVEFNAPPEGEIVIDGDPCNGEVRLTFQLTRASSAGFTYNWNTGNQTPSITVTQSNNYIVEVRNQQTGCSNTFSADVTVEEELAVAIVPEPDCDNNGEIFLIANTANTNVTYQWFENGAVVSGAVDSVFRVTQTGNYSVTMTAGNGNCSVSDNFSAVVAPIDESLITLPGSDTYCGGDPTNPTITLDAGTGFTAYRWRLAPSDSIIGTSSTLVVGEEGRYSVDIIEGSACITRDIVVTEDCLPRLEAPNAFSPNGDATNEEFFVFPNDYVDQFEIFIYTRWGELIYKSNSQDFRWDGTFGGKPVQVGTYTYVIRFTSSLEPNLKEITQRGTITLLR